MPDAAVNTADLFEIIQTTRSMRRLAGMCAPSGENMQRWRRSGWLFDFRWGPEQGDRL